MTEDLKDPDDAKPVSIRSTMGVSYDFKTFEVEVIEPGNISIGVMCEVYDLDEFPGDNQGSVVFNMTDAK